MITKLHQWQKECLEIWLKNKGRGIINVATGAGKTILALACADSLNKCLVSEGDSLKIKIVVPKVFMLSQWSESIISELSFNRADIGLWGGGVKEKNKRIMMYVLNSARYTLAKDILRDLKEGNPVLLICDECHHMGSGENSKIFDFIPFLKETETPFFSLGLSATPDSQGYNTILVPSLGREIYRYGMIEALDSGIVSRYMIFNIGLDFTKKEAEVYNELSDKLGISLRILKNKLPYLQNLSGRKFYEKLQYLCEHGEEEISVLAGAFLNISYRRKELIYTAKARTDCVLSLLERIAGERKIIIFGERIDMCEALYQRLCILYPGKAGRYHSAMSEQAKREALNNYADAMSGILVTCRAFDEGLNIPDTDAGILLSSTGSIRQRIQRVGRLLRSYTSKGVKSVYYLYIPESSEEVSLLPPDKHKDIITVELFFNSETREFINSQYDELCSRFIESLTENGNLSESQWDQIIKCLKTGAVCGDYLSSPEICRLLLDEAESIQERNYRIVMLKLAELLEDNHVPE